MPRISEFYGIEIIMNYNDHVPPHFHAIYNEYEALVGIDPVQIIQGHLPNRVWRRIRQWATKYQGELMTNWQLTRAQLPLNKIPPLK